jgi:hypothetical protein
MPAYAQTPTCHRIEGGGTMNYIQIVVAGGGMISLLANALPCGGPLPNCGAGETDYDKGTIRRVSIVESKIPDDNSCVWGLEAGDSLNLELMDNIEMTAPSGCLSPDFTCLQNVWALRSDIGIPLEDADNAQPSDSFLDLELALDPTSGCRGNISVQTDDVLGPDKQKAKYYMKFRIEWEETEEGACEALGLVPIGEIPGDESATDEEETSGSASRAARNAAGGRGGRGRARSGACRNSYYVDMQIVDEG